MFKIWYAPELRRCPVSQITPGAEALVAAWGDWHTFGMLPYPGSIGEQPAWVLSAFRVVENALAEQARLRAALPEDHAARKG